MTIPPELQLTINDWYDDREICDDEKFPVYFQRLLNQTFPLYQELLRVQPGYAHYDWLVTMYQEQETKGENGYTDLSSSNKKSTNSGSDSASRSSSTEKTGSVEVADSGTDRNSSSGSRTSTKAGTEQTDHSFDGYTETMSGSDDTAYGKSVSNKPGAKIQQVVDYIDNDGSKDRTTNNGASVAKAAPQSISYSGATAGQIPELDWGFPSSQSQEKGETENLYQKSNRTTTTTELLGDTSNDESWSGNDITSHSSSLTKDGKSTDKTSFTDRQDSEVSSDSGSTTYGKTTTTTYNKPTDKTEDSTTTNYGHVVDDQEDSKSEHKGGSLQRVQSTGRTGTIAGILEEACSFIKGSNAFFWLTGELDKVFWGIYDL